MDEMRIVSKFTKRNYFQSVEDGGTIRKLDTTWIFS